MRRPTVLFADEPTGNLDSNTSRDVLALLRDSVDELGQTIVMVTHDPQAAAQADRILFLADGHIVKEMPGLDRGRGAGSDAGSERTMTAVALRGLLGRKLRSILTGLAIVLGVAMISGTYILTDTIDKAFTNVFNVSYRHTDAIISGKQFVTNANSVPTVPAAVLARVRALPDVAAASGSYLFDNVQLIDRHGKTIANGGAPSLGFGVDPSQPRFNPITLTSGHWAEGPGQVVIDTATAANKHYKVGDAIAAKGDGALKTYTVVGLGKISGVSIGGATLAVFDVPTAASILNKSGYDDISVAAKPGVSERRLAAEIKPLLPPVAEVRTGSQQASHDAAEVTAGSQLVRYLLLAFGAIALFVGAFVIFNTITITIAQRTRELATLRTLGASRRQVLRSVLLESFVIGLGASVVGLFAGIGLAKGLNAVFVALGVEPSASGHGARGPHDRRFAARGNARDLRSGALPGDPSHPGAAHLRGARGRGPAQLAHAAPTAVRRWCGDVARPGSDPAGPVRHERSRVGAAAARGGNAAAVHRRRDGLELRRPTARVDRRASSPRPRRHRRPSGGGQLRPQHQPHRGHGSRVDDRARADRVRGHARRRAAPLGLGRPG